MALFKPFSIDPNLSEETLLKVTSWLRISYSFIEYKMETLSRLSSALPSIHEDDLSQGLVDVEQRFRPTRKAIDAELSNPESGGVTWEQMIERLLEIFESDEVDIDEVRVKSFYYLYFSNK